MPARSLALIDQLSLSTNSRVASFLRGAGAPDVYMVHVGMGWALARLRRRPQGPLSDFDPVLRWLALDGYGFHEGYFAPARYVPTPIPDSLREALRPFAG